MTDFKRIVPPSGPDAPVDTTAEPGPAKVHPDGGVSFGSGLSLPPPMGAAEFVQDNDDVAMRVRPDPGPGMMVSEPPQPADYEPPPEYQPRGSSSQVVETANLCKTCERCWSRLIVGEFESGPGGPRGRFERWCQQPPYLIDLREREVVECNLYIIKES